MPTGIEIAGIIIASTGMGSSVASKVAKFARKGTAQRTYDDVAHQYTQLKDLREDENINRFLSEKDKKHLDGVIERIAFDLMDLQLTLHELRGVAYYKITTYPVQWIDFHDQVAMVFKQIVEVNLDIRERSTKGRDQARPSSTEQVSNSNRRFIERLATISEKAGLPESGSTSPSTEDSASVVQGLASGDSIDRQIVDSMASSGMSLNV
ncbi:hypothetical protein RSOLAG22IIIB_12149 [Rhizoctonia solani]|uniref:Uncharacterized protein n=1 Tax=Rhizoctonia solani TaxID=456999 RepID=A0A0K6GCN7_9AGAM|nr:hypothetical protein RSOLAG22IIIB_12149 [Rhizoctonia solani]